MFNSKNSNNNNSSSNRSAYDYQNNQNEDHPGWEDFGVVARKGETKVILSNGRYIEVPA